MSKDVVVSYLRGKQVDGLFLDSMVALVGNEPRIHTVHGIASGPAVAANRNKLARFLLASDCQWLFMVDTDMTFAPDALFQLLAVASPERPVVGGLCFTADEQGGQVNPTLYRFHPDGHNLLVGHDYPDNTLLEVDATGGACVLAHRSAFEAIGDKGSLPWFEEVPHPGDCAAVGCTEGYDSEDITFFRRLKAAGIPAFVHTGVEFGHVKPHVVNAATHRAARRTAA